MRASQTRPLTVPSTAVNKPSAWNRDRGRSISYRRGCLSWVVAAATAETDACFHDVPRRPPALIDPLKGRDAGFSHAIVWALGSMHLAKYEK